MKENSTLREDIKQLKLSLQSKEREVSVLKTSLEKASKTNETLKTELPQQAKDKLQKQVEETAYLYSALGDLEQYTRKNSLEIHGIPEDCYSTTEEVILKFATALNANVNPGDIEITHKLKWCGNNSSPVIVKFISHKVKTSLYKERVKLRNAFKCRMCFPVIPMQWGLKNLESFSTKTWRIIDEDLYREQAKWKKWWAFDEILDNRWQNLCYNIAEWRSCSNLSTTCERTCCFTRQNNVWTDRGKFTFTAILTNNLISLLINSEKREIWVGAFTKVSTQFGL